MRFSLGGTGRDGKRRISNGRLDEVKGFDKDGHLLLKSGMTVDRNYGHLELGYVVTSHASQGKDHQLAIAAMGPTSLPAINARQFYVTVSRGSEDVAIYVDDMQRVRQAIARSGEQMSATEMVSTKLSQRSSERPTRAATRHQNRHRDLVRGFRNRMMSWFRSQLGERLQDTARSDG